MNKFTKAIVQTQTPRLLIVIQDLHCLVSGLPLIKYQSLQMAVEATSQDGKMRKCLRLQYTQDD